MQWRLALKKKATKKSDVDGNLVQCALDCGLIHADTKKVSFRDEVGHVFMKVDKHMSRYSYKETFAPRPKAEDCWSWQEARATIDARDALRAIRVGHELRKEVEPEVQTVTNVLSTDNKQNNKTERGRHNERRWVIDSGSCVDIVGESTVTKSEQKAVVELDEPMRLSTANGKVTVSKWLKVPLRSSMLANALVMKN